MEVNSNAPHVPAKNSPTVERSRKKIEEELKGSPPTKGQISDVIGRIHLQQERHRPTFKQEKIAKVITDSTDPEVVLTKNKIQKMLGGMDQSGPSA